MGGAYSDGQFGEVEVATPLAASKPRYLHKKSR
jgi:hypothetical protein